MNEFESAVAAFDKKTVGEVEQLISEGNGVVVFIGRATCPFCRRFAPKMNEAREQLGIPAIFVNSEEATQLRELSEFRDKFGIPTVPGLLVAKEGRTNVVCDSSLSVEAIKEFIKG